MTRTVILTGAASGIGLDTALCLAAAGWRVVMLDRDAPGLDLARARLATVSGADHLALAVDLTDAAAIAGLPARIDGPIAALVNNAGLSDGSGVAIADRDFASLEPVLALNLDAPRLLIEAFMPRFAGAARIVNISSGAGLRAIPWRGAYSASKAGLIAFGAAWSMANPGHELITLCPGFFRTAMVQGLIDEGRLSPVQAVAKIPLGRMGEPAEIARFIAFLLSPDAAGLAGQCISLDGGSSVFGGSQAFGPASNPPVDGAAGSQLIIDGVAAAQGSGYPAHVCTATQGLSARSALIAAQKAARDFAAATTGPASLTLVLSPPDAADPAEAAAHGALRMMVGALACELGPSGRRINAVLSDAAIPPAAIAMIAGVDSQFLTGQLLQFRKGASHG